MYNLQAASNKRKTFVFLTVDAHGHINSMMGLADQLRQLGHRTIFLCTDNEVPKKRGHEIYNYRTKKESETDEKIEGESDIFLAKELNDRLEEIVRKISYNVNKREYLLEALTKNHSFMVEFWRDTTIKYDQSVEEFMLKSKPDVCIVDAVTPFPCIRKLACDLEYCKKMGLKGTIPWISFLSCNPMPMYHAYGDGKFPPAFMNLPAGKLTIEEIEAEDELMIQSYKTTPWADTKRLILKMSNMPNTDQLTDRQLYFGEEAMNVSPWLNIYMFPEAIDYAGEHGVYLPEDRWLRIDSFIREPLPSKCNEKDVEFFKQVKHWKDSANVKVIYVSMGTTICLYLEIMDSLARQVFTCLRKHPDWNIVMSLGVRASKMSNENLEAIKVWEEKGRLIAREWIPQPELMRRKLIDACVTHGGNNTICELFHHRVPHLVVMSGFYDQLDNARRVADLGYGVSLAVTDLLEADLKEDLLSNSIEKCLQLEPKINDGPLRDARFCAQKILEKLNSVGSN